MSDQRTRVTGEPRDEVSGSPWIRLRARRDAAGPQPLALWSLAYPTVASLGAVFGIGRTETHYPGGLPATLMLWIAGPALFVNMRQKVRNGGRALAVGAVLGVAACLLFTFLLGSERVSVDFAGIVVGVFVFDIAYWLVSKRP